MSNAHAAASGNENSAPKISTFAGTGPASSQGDNAAAVLAQLNGPYGVAVDGVGNIYISDFSGHRVRRVTTDGKISTYAGTGVAGPGGDNGLATAAQLSFPRGLAVDSAGALYIADSGNHRIRKVTADGKMSTVAGTGAGTYGGDGGLATAAHLNLPMDVAVDSDGSLYITDFNNHRVRRVTTDRKISTFAGTASPGPGGDGGPAGSAQLRNPHGVAVDGAGNVYIADQNNHRVRMVAADKTISTVAGTGVAKHGGDNGPATAAQLNLPVGVVVDSAGNLYIADQGNQRVRMVAADKTISTVAGTGVAKHGGDNGPATAAQLNNPYGLAVDCVDALYIADYSSNRVRKVASAKMAGLPDAGTVVSWANVRSKLRMGVVRESVKDGAEVHQLLAVPRDHQRWRLIPAGQDNGDVLYRIENLRSGKVLEIVGAQEANGAVVAQRDYEGAEARHQQWRLIPVGSVTDSPRVFEIANGNSGLLLRIDTNARTVIKQHGSEGDHRERQWHLLPV
ncbi:RICIN domain-containing protein [Streptomyces caniscabiei]|uniref:RICIN domain-containing protein n=3 Tax=Streptomyces caniscabiei TaxID=2746961 RepID=A0A927L4L6_9ACTN|nr:RICIN domain-containing protein [Streptomyces caniscabiei]MBD9722498.1 RICIN domain-containing protein [Streptomyces caniscabiei]MDX3732016.1 RICIN domain-containing protein [Streptomyces caniscabiei]WEO29826.1 RICIN domain-containing protein [Streptomyces caniscabiei]